MICVAREGELRVLELHDVWNKKYIVIGVSQFYQCVSSSAIDIGNFPAPIHGGFSASNDRVIEIPLSHFGKICRRWAVPLGQFSGNSSALAKFLIGIPPLQFHIN
jgi:hypothetical protein